MAQVSIEYCVVWNYLPRAARVAALIEQELGESVDLVKGGRGIFEVRVHGRVVASKSPSGFLTEQQALQAVRAAL